MGLGELLMETPGQHSGHIVYLHYYSPLGGNLSHISHGRRTESGSVAPFLTFMISKQGNHPHPSPSCYSPSFWLGGRLPPSCVRTGGNSAREAPRRRGWNSRVPSKVVQYSGVNDLMMSQDSIHCLEGTLLQEGSSNMKSLSRISTPARQESWASGRRLPGDQRSPLTFQSSTASSRKMRIPTSKLMAMIQPTT